ncbi:MAG: hypothetical protein R2729_24605 [Bryobacteraceae bacterium]
MKITVGAEPKKVAIAAGLMLVAGYLMYTNIFTSDAYGVPPASTPVAKAPSPLRTQPLPAERPAANNAAAAIPAPPRRATRTQQSMREWVPKIGGARPEERADPATTDPRLRLDLLARLQNITSSGGHRSLFDFSTEPVKVPDVKIVPKKGAEEAKAADAKPPEETKPAGEEKASKPPPPPIPLKFYGYVAGREGKRAFFLNGEDIFTVLEGQTVKSRYRIVRIGTTSAEVLDTEHDHKQTIPIEPEPPPTG